MNWIEKKYLLWYYEKQPKNKLLDRIGEYFNSKLNDEMEWNSLVDTYGEKEAKKILEGVK